MQLFVSANLCTSQRLPRAEIGLWIKQLAQLECSEEDMLWFLFTRYTCRASTMYLSIYFKHHQNKKA